MKLTSLTESALNLGDASESALNLGEASESALSVGDSLQVPSPPLKLVLLVDGAKVR